MENTSNQIHHWRTTDKAEVDFVLDKNTEVVPIEVKYRNLSTPAVTRSFQNFVSTYHPSTGYVIHLGQAMQQQINSSPIHFMNWAQWLFEGV